MNNINHIAFIMDGNGRWGKKRGKSRNFGHLKGVKIIEKLVKERMNKFNEEVSHWNEYNYVVINDDLEICYKKIIDTIMKEKEGIVQKQNFIEIENKIKELTE